MKYNNELLNGTDGMLTKKRSANFPHPLLCLLEGLV